MICEEKLNTGINSQRDGSNFLFRGRCEYFSEIKGRSAANFFSTSNNWLLVEIKSLTVADDFSHECVDIAVDYGISGKYLTRLLD